MLYDPQPRPRRIRDLFRSAVDLYTNAVPLATLIVAPPLIVLTLIQLFILQAPAVQQVVALVQYGLVNAALNAALISAASQIATQQPASLSESYACLGRRYGVLFFALSLQGIALVMLVLLLWLVLQRRIAWLQAPALTGLAVLLLALLLIFFFVRSSLVSAVAALERHGPGGTLWRSWRLTRQGFWRALLVGLICMLLGTLAMRVPVLAMALIFRQSASVAAQWAYAISATILIQLCLALVWPIQAILTTALYYDLLARERPISEALLGLGDAA